MQFIQAGMAAASGMPVGIIELLDGEIHEAVPEDSRMSYSSFCTYLKGNPSIPDLLPGVQGGHKACCDCTYATAKGILDKDAGTGSEWQSHSCHLGLIDYFRSIELNGARAVIVTGQHLPQDGLKTIADRLEQIERGEIDSPIRFAKGERQELLRLAEDLKPCSVDDLRKLDTQIARFLQLTSRMYTHRVFEAESQIAADMDEISSRQSDGSANLDRQSPQQRPPRLYPALLAFLCDTFHAAQAILFFANSDHGNVLYPKAAHGTCAEPDKALPHFNWNKSGLSGGESPQDSFRNAESVARRGVRGPNATDWREPFAIVSYSTGIELRGVLVIGRPGIPVASDDEMATAHRMCVRALRRMLSTHLQVTLGNERNQTRDRLVFLAHQVRMRLAAIKSAIDGFRRIGITPDQQEQWETQCHELNLVHSDLARVSRKAAEPGFALSMSSELLWQPVSPASIIDDAAERQEGYARQRRISLVQHPSLGEIGEIQGDAFRLQVLFLQLINNAIKYSRTSRSRRGRVTIVGSTQEERGVPGVAVRIRNYGLGILEDDLEKVFERGVRRQGMSRGDRYGRRRGLGMGLFECHQIVVAHRGRIWATSRSQSEEKVTQENIDRCVTDFHVFLPCKHTEMEGWGV